MSSYIFEDQCKRDERYLCGREQTPQIWWNYVLRGSRFLWRPIEEHPFQFSRNTEGRRPGAETRRTEMVIGRDEVGMVTDGLSVKVGRCFSSCDNTRGELRRRPSLRSVEHLEQCSHMTQPRSQPLLSEQTKSGSCLMSQEGAYNIYLQRVETWGERFTWITKI